MNLCFYIRQTTRQIASLLDEALADLEAERVPVMLATQLVVRLNLLFRCLIG